MNRERRMDKVGRYEFLAEPFHCDFSHRIFMGHLGNHMLNAADFHSTERNFGMTRLNPIHKTWVLSRLAIEMVEMPKQYTRFTVETWVESAMRYFTNRNFRILSGDTIYGYGRSIWAMIDTENRQPQDILAINDGAIQHWLEPIKNNTLTCGIKNRFFAFATNSNKNIHHAECGTVTIPYGFNTLP